MVIDARTGEIFYEKNADPQRAAASTQKLLTALIVAERGFLDRTRRGCAGRYACRAGKAEYQSGRTYTSASICCARCW